MWAASTKVVSQSPTIGEQHIGATTVGSEMGLNCCKSLMMFLTLLCCSGSLYSVSSVQLEWSLMLWNTARPCRSSSRTAQPPLNRWQARQVWPRTMKSGALGLPSMGGVSARTGPSCNETTIPPTCRGRHSPHQTAIFTHGLQLCHNCSPA